ncbi:phage terminase small subunit [Microbacterium arborescens]
MPGPAPDPNARRRNKRPAAMTLPANGREGRAPAFPIKTGKRVPTVWASLWKTPQAVAWEKLGYHRVVARYAMLLQIVETPETATAALLGEVRQLEDRLGLSPMAMKRLEWVIKEDELAAKRDEKRSASDTSAGGRTPEQRRKIMGAVK